MIRHSIAQGCSRDRQVRDQDRGRKIFPVSISTLALRPKLAKFETKTETGKNDAIIVFFDFLKRNFWGSNLLIS